MKDLTKNIPKEEIQDLTGDPVFDYLKTWVLSDHKLLGGRIVERNGVGPKVARKIISILIQTPKNGVKQQVFNYKKIERELQNEKRKNRNE